MHRKAKISVASWLLRKGFTTCLLANPISALAATTCIDAASQYHQVNNQILTAILYVESGFRPETLTTNSNRTKDHGMGGINSTHLPVLSKYGIDANDLMNPCVNIYVAAWHLRNKIAQHGNTWFGIAAYHSVTPYHNDRYQALLHNAFVELGYTSDRKVKIPALRAHKRTDSRSDVNEGVSNSMRVVDK